MTEKYICPECFQTGYVVIEKRDNLTTINCDFCEFSVSHQSYKTAYVKFFGLEPKLVENQERFVDEFNDVEDRANKIFHMFAKYDESVNIVYFTGFTMDHNTVYLNGAKSGEDYWTLEYEIETDLFFNTDIEYVEKCIMDFQNNVC